MDVTSAGDGTGNEMATGERVMIRLTGVGKTYPDGTQAVHELDLGDVADSDAGHA